jgi:SSS family solute:Na+ symporter
MKLLDTTIIILFLLITFVIAIYSSRKNKSSSTEEYFLAGRSLGWFAIGISIFAANISSEHIIGLAGYGASRGLAIANFELFAIPFLLVIGWVLSPILLKANVFTIPEFLAKRHNTTLQLIISGLSIFIYLFTKVFVSLYAAGILFREFLAWDMYQSCIVVIGLTGLYTIIGGMRAVVNTSIFQGLVLLIGASVLAGFGFYAIGSLSVLKSQLPESYFSLFLSANDPELPWTGMVLGAPILAFWYWCSDQYILQRILSAKNVSAARKGTMLTGVLKLLPIVLFVLPGLLAVALYPGINGDNAFPTLLSNVELPIGLKGLVIAGVLAALMSSLSSAFISSATLFTMDFYRFFKPKAGNQHLALVGRLSIMVMVLLAVSWAPLMRAFDQRLYVHLQSFQAYVAPPISAIFFWTFFSNKLTARGAMIALFVGEFFGVLRLVYEVFGADTLSGGGFTYYLFNINFLHFAFLLFVLTSLTGLVVSYFQQSPVKQPNYNWYYPSLYFFGKNNNVTGKGVLQSSNTKADLLFSGLLVVILVTIWGIFT